MDERPIPAAALRDVNAVEMLRAWIAERQLHCSIKIGFYEEVVKTSEGRAWGITLADVTRHVASAMAKAYGSESSEVISQIRDSFLRELDKPTSEVAGEFQPPNQH